jgi:hypothetical protein
LDKGVARHNGTASTSPGLPNVVKCQTTRTTTLQRWHPGERLKGKGGKVLVQLLKYEPKQERILTPLENELILARREIRQGRFQRSMALISAFAAIVSGFESYVQHQRGAFKDPLMWTPVLLTLPMVGTAGAALFSQRAARIALPVASTASLLDGLVGFIYHVRGIARMPGGFKVGQYNIVMGPPVFAPLLMSSVGILGLLASLLRRERLADLQPGAASVRRRLTQQLPHVEPHKPLKTELAHGRFQQGMALLSAFLAVLAGGEAYFEHFRGSYNQRLMWTPVWVTPPMVAAAVGACKSPEVAQKVLPLASLVTFGDGLLGFYLHLRGIKRMPGGFGNTVFNMTMGPPLFAPLLFIAVGLIGFIASLMRRE